jgi:hypothetical protein
MVHYSLQVISKQFVCRPVAKYLVAHDNTFKQILDIVILSHGEHKKKKEDASSFSVNRKMTILTLVGIPIIPHYTKNIYRIPIIPHYTTNIYRKNSVHYIQQLTASISNVFTGQLP